MPKTLFCQGNNRIFYKIYQPNQYPVSSINKITLPQYLPQQGYLKNYQ